VKTLVANGRVAEPDRIREANLLLEEGRIAAVTATTAERPAADRVVDASGCYVLPGLIDFHVHVGDRIGRFELADDYESGSRAGLLGGVTTLCAFVTQEPGETLGQALRRARARAEGRTHADVWWHLTPTRFDEADRRETEELVRGGYRTVKLYTTYRPAGLFADGARLDDLFGRLGPLGARFLLHCEDDLLLAAVDPALLDLSSPSSHARLRPEEAEVASVEALLARAGRSGVPLHVVHVSTSAAAERIAAAKKDQDVTCETCPQYLWLDDEQLGRADGHRWICSPPLRGGRDRFRALAREGAFDLLATDHCAFLKGDKDGWDGRDVRTVAGGVAGIGALAQLAWKLWEDDPDRAAAEVALRLAENPAARLGLSGTKGALREGLDADVVVLDPAAPARPVRSTLADSYETYPGVVSRLQVRHVFLRGIPVVEDGRLAGAGRPQGRPLQAAPTNIRNTVTETAPQR
jgi:dihydropyrimidinase